nr:glycosyltransferase family 39 protein [Anaerolinea sp.]
MLAENTSPSWLDRPLVKEGSGLKIETFLVILIILVAILSRFTLLGERVMSHDEVNHVWPSYDFFKGKGYAHNPVTHGPFQFHVVALSYFLFGDNDFTSRIPAATLSTAAVVFVLFGFRRYLGRTGALIAGFLFLISPYLLFYGRYTRNEGFIELFMVIMVYAVLRHLEKGDDLSLYLFSGMIVMHFITKETSFIYMAEMLVFLM